MYGSLCEPWPLIWCGDISGINPEVTGHAAQAASEILWMATGQRFGNCPVTVRPCRQDCNQFPVDTRVWSAGVWQDSGWPYPTLLNGEWINLACGLCAGQCSCSASSEVVLPDPVWEITEVVVDGTSIPASGYAIYDGVRLVRVGSEWPMCQDWEVTEGVGAWHLTARFGAPVPTLGQQAVGILAFEIAKQCCGMDCNLPPHITSVTRQGVTMQKMNPKELLDAGLTGLYLPDMFISRYNPSGIMDRARAWSPDVLYPRVQQ